MTAPVQRQSDVSEYRNDPTIQNDLLGDRQLCISSPWRKVKHKNVQSAPIDLM